MFGLKLKQQCQILSDENLTLKIEIDQLRAEHKRVCEENQQIQQQLTSAQSRERFFLECLPILLILANHYRGSATLFRA